MTRPDTPFEAASYDLNKFRERRIADRRFSARTSADRRHQCSGSQETSGQDMADKNSVPSSARQPD